MLRDKKIEERLSGKELETYIKLSELGDKGIIGMGVVLVVSWVGCWIYKKIEEKINEN